MLNGRFSRDSDGNFTCFSNDGASLVDYMIASSNLFPYIRNFCVLDKDDLDHFPISRESIVVESLKPIKRYKWNKSRMSCFIDNFKKYVAKYMYIPFFE